MIKSKVEFIRPYNMLSNKFDFTITKSEINVWFIQKRPS